MNRDQIAQFISVGLEYLWLDEVSELTDSKIVSCKRIDPDLPVLQQHYRGFPLFPGALQCEACFQAANVLLTKLLPENPSTLPVIARVQQVKFKRLVRPGDVLTIEVTLEDRTAKAIRMKGTCRVADEVSTSLRFTATEAPRPQEMPSAPLTESK